MILDFGIMLLKIDYPEGAYMKSFRQFGVLILLLVSYLTPAMACMVSDLQMSSEERACCHAMQNHCGQMRMPASHGCCQKAPHSAADKALLAMATNVHPMAVAVAWLGSCAVLQPSFTTADWAYRPDYSPPQFPPGASSVLRI